MRLDSNTGCFVPHELGIAEELDGIAVSVEAANHHVLAGEWQSIRQAIGIGLPA